MKKRKSNKPQPRYITIRIQYYPINKKIISLCLLFFISFGIDSLNRHLFSQWKGSFTKSVPASIYTSLLDVPKETVKYIQKGVIFHGERTRKDIALTFDADMTPGMKVQLDSGEVASYYNKNVIDILNQTKTKATLFLTGMWIEQYPYVSEELARNPLFELASHSYSHPGFDGYCYGLTPIPDSDDFFQINKTQILLKNLTGIDNRYFRFPGGCYSDRDVEIMNKNNLAVIQWDDVGDDGFNDDPLSIENNVISRVQNGSIIVLHMHGGPNAPKTAEALPVIIKTLKQRGFTFVTLSELLTGSCHSLPPSDVLTSLRALDGGPPLVSPLACDKL